MNKLSIHLITAALVGAASFSAVAQPQPRGPGGAGPSAGGPSPHLQHSQPQPSRPQAQAPRGPQKPAHMQRAGSGPDHRWTKGSRVPSQYRGRHYVVNDWQRHGLHRPGRGQQWVQYGGDYLLVASATGVIVQIIMGR